MISRDKKLLLRKIPQISRILQESSIKKLSTIYGKTVVSLAISKIIEELKKSINNEEELKDALNSLAANVEKYIKNTIIPSISKVINATGTLIHTNLGRTPLDNDILTYSLAVLTRYIDLEFNLYTGQRGDRLWRIAKMLSIITGCDSALVVNNNAAALYLVGKTFGEGKEVIIGMDEVIEIGDNFRLMEILKASGTKVRIVGSTNKTYISDYKNAISREKTGFILKVKKSNFNIEGFTTSPTVKELVRLAKTAKIPLFVDEGSGKLIDTNKIDIPFPSVKELIDMGVDLVLFSSDKLLYGPQGGIIVGKHILINRLRKSPLYRTFRVGKFTIVYLEKLLSSILIESNMPIEKNLPDLGNINKRTEKIKKVVGGEIIKDCSYLGGGSGVLTPIEVPALAFPYKKKTLEKLLLSNPPIVPHVKHNKIIINLTTVFPDEDKIVIERLKQILYGKNSSC